ncbi:flavin reductase (DIM6/NTAB) family NADH-FMN oxidoreductase RutF [Scopulibacillus darangshiensis]|uniref:Flavin reductase (DIM6/NTAB) family NADH-FMN oxidoreductase RutF n=1 Tax=Scopulibacillus darangshiensis TaxID=442528 RepID=A0A4R2P5Q7_9BACL|nr:flavin reductase family protein [Scopulibacillus darangshiensis]TCP30190.1 flavin reductase (DIM6/NTAB) family NADH-FMN oxidoreductase RutF [Scopulibacillus darangshiensis]
MDDRTFRDAMGKFATGITVITTVIDDHIHGMTANAFMSVSLDPKLITVSIDEKAHMYDKMQQTGKFAVSILSDKQTKMSMHFAGQKEKEDVEFDWHGGVPVIKDALANIICNVYDSHKVGDHTLFIGEVVDLHLSEGDPLTFFGGKYGHNQLIKFHTV